MKTYTSIGGSARQREDQLWDSHAPSEWDSPKVFARKLEKYRTGKGTLQFAIDQPIPLELVRRIVELRVKESSAKSRM